MKAYKEQTVYVINTTPKQLRALADKMENKFPNKTVGDSTCIDIIYSDDATIKICGDQDHYQRHMSRNKSTWI